MNVEALSASSLTHVTAEGEEVEVAAVMPQKTYESADFVLLCEESTAIVEGILSSLSDIDKKVIELCIMGRDGNEEIDPLTLREVGLIVNRSHERVRQIRDAALVKIKRKVLKHIDDLAI